MTERTRVTPVEENKLLITPESFFGMHKNICAISQLPVRINGFREKFVNLFKQELKKGFTHVALLNMDLDGLKSLNMKLGHDKANIAIKHFVDETKKRIDEFKKEHNEDASFYLFFKPQAGGDEFELILTYKGIDKNDDSSNELLTKLQEIISEPVDYNAVNLEGENEDFLLISSVAIGTSILSNDKRKLYQSLKDIYDESNTKMDLIKLKKINDKLEKLVRDGVKETAKLYMELVAERFGNRRISPKALKIIGQQHEAKLIKEISAGMVMLPRT